MCSEQCAMLATESLAASRAAAGGARTPVVRGKGAGLAASPAQSASVADPSIPRTSPGHASSVEGGRARQCCGGDPRLRHPSSDQTPSAEELEITR